MLPFPCSTCDKKLPAGSSCCIIPDTAASLSYTIGVPNGTGIGVNFLEKNTDKGKAMYMIPVNTSLFDVSASGEELTRDSHKTDITPIGTDMLSMQISSIDYNNTSDSADGSFVVIGTVTCPKGSYTMSLTATWAFEEVPPTQSPATVEES